MNRHTSEPSYCCTSKLFSTHLSTGRLRKFDRFFSSRVTDLVLYRQTAW